jgi:hypothetical protein
VTIAFSDDKPAPRDSGRLSLSLRSGWKLGQGGPGGFDQALKEEDRYRRRSSSPAFAGESGTAQIRT